LLGAVETPLCVDARNTVELQGNRNYFVCRRVGMINVSSVAERLKGDIFMCPSAFARYEEPAAIRFTPPPDVEALGKMVHV
jgi:hypothetical protein